MSEYGVCVYVCVCERERGLGLKVWGLGFTWGAGEEEGDEAQRSEVTDNVEVLVVHLVACCLVFRN